MSISFTRYVNIVSGVAGASVVATRALIGRLFTNNPLLPATSFAEFTSAADVGAYFGTASGEYLRALFYFSWVSPGIQQAQKISFARWVSAACAPQIYGNQTTKLLATFQAITAGSFQLTLGGVTNSIGPLNLSSAGSLNAVAAAIQTAIQGNTGTLWTAATVVFNAALQSFVLTGGVAGAASINLVDGTQTLGAALGWTPPVPENGVQITGPNLSTYAIWAPGAAAEDPAACIGASAQASNNFGSFLFIPALTQTQMVELAAWTSGQNVLYRYCQAVNASNAAAISAALIGFTGGDLALSPLSSEYPEMVDMIQEAATDYTQANATSDYMFKQFGLTPSVTDDADANTYDALRVNYYGVTQESGQNVAFWQRGVMMGGATAPVDANVFSNESWLKSDIGAGIINLQLAVQKVSANTAGENALTNTIQASIQRALLNGTISVGKTFTPQQIAAITAATTDPNAWRQVQTSGYWFRVVIVPYVDPYTGLAGYAAQYTLVYSKDDVVRFVSGQNVLI